MASVAASPTTSWPCTAPRRRPRAAARRAATQLRAANGTAAEAAQLGVQWAVEVMRHTLTLPQVLQHLLQLDRIEAATAHRDSIRGCTSPRCQQRFSWVEPGLCGCDPLSESTGWQDCKEAEQLAALAAMPPHLLTPPQHAALVMHAWQAQAHVKPTEAFDSDAQLTLPGLADVAVVSRGGWQRHSWKTSNQDAFLALPLAAGGSGTACCSSAVAIGVFDGHGRAGQAASAHLRNALASGLCMHNQLALMAQPACQPEQQQQQQQQAQQQQAPQPASAAAVLLEEEAAAAQLLERCFAAAASTMPSTGADFSLSGSTAVMCLVQPGSVTAAWAGDSRAVLGLHSGQRYISCALTHDHRPSSPLERARIEQSGGWVMQTMLDDEGRPAGPHRVYLRETNIPGLAVSRCFGDYVATSAGVTATPDITTFVLPLTSDTSATAAAAVPAAAAATGQQAASRNSKRRRKHKGRQGGCDSAPTARQAGAGVAAPPAAAGAGGASTAASLGLHVLIVGSDGLWEFIDSADAVALASCCASAREAAEMLTREAQAQWALKLGGSYCDDITCAVAFLPGSCSAAAAAGSSRARASC